MGASELSAQLQTQFQEALELHRKGRHGEAGAIYASILERAPDHADSIHLLGVIAFQSGNHRRAVELIEQAIALSSVEPSYYTNLGNARKELRQFDAALASYDLAIALHPDAHDAWCNRGNLLREMGQLRAAVASYDKAIAIRPDYAMAWSNRGNVLKELKQLKAALVSYDRAIAVSPGYPEAWYNRANTLLSMKQHEAAAQSYDRAIALQPGHAEAFYNRGNALLALNRHEAAVQSYEGATAIRPHFAEAWSNRGVALSELNRFEDSLRSYDRAIQINPAYAEALLNRGIALHELSRFDEAKLSYERAIALRPEYAEAHWNTSLLLLTFGEFERGWELYEWRWKNDKFPSKRRNFPRPLWLGRESIQGKRILLHGEQGLGDTIQFCRYATLVAELGAQVILEVQPPLCELLRGLEGVSEVVGHGELLPPFDFHTPLLSLPLAFRTGIDTIPAAPAYLKADPARIEQWQRRLGEKTRPRVGVVWSGGTLHKGDHYRSIPLSTLMQHLPGGIEYVSLQQEVRDLDREALSGVLHFGSELKDFTDTAALCTLMDLVISVDTSVAHLAGALGRPVHILLPRHADWRWMLDRGDTPWYPSAILWRQTATGDWARVLDALARELEPLAPQPGPEPAEALSQRGISLYERKRWSEALECFEKAIALEPRHPEFWSNRGLAQFEMKRLDAAILSFDKAIAIDPGYAPAWSNRGMALHEQNNVAGAVSSYQQAVTLRPDFAAAWYNLGMAFQSIHQLEASIESYDRAIALNPDYSEAWANKSLVLLLQGEFALGFELYEWRWKNGRYSPGRRIFSKPLWLGRESLKERTILLHSEQGFGDSIQFCRYAALVAGLGARVILEVQQPLVGLLSPLAGVSKVVAQGSPLPPFDFHCPMLSLPLALKTTLETIPSRAGYLQADPARVGQWKKRLGSRSKPRVGLVWSGNAGHRNDSSRSIPLATLLHGLPGGIEYVSLQPEVRDADKEALEGVLHFGSDLKDFGDTAALCTLMDIVVSVDTSVAHLAGALGRPTWMLLPFNPDWRWMQERSDSPWYASVKLYRQPALGEWAGVLGLLALDLAAATGA